jgi:hypothetical protein
MTRLFIWKAALAGAGLVVGLAGMALALRWLVWIAVALAGGAFALRFAERRDGETG